MKKGKKATSGGKASPEVKSYKITPLKRIYYNKFKYKVNLIAPVTTSEMYRVYLPKNRAFPGFAKKEPKEVKEIAKKVANFKKIISSFLTDAYGIDNSNIYKIYGTTKTMIYGTKHTLYLKNNNEVDLAIRHFGEYITEIEQPINDKHLSIYDENIFLEREMRHKLYFNKYRYKAIYHSYNPKKLKDKESELTDIFSGKPTDSFFIRANYCSLSICLNNKEDLLLLKLSTPDIKAYYEVILISELKENENEQ